MAQGLPAGLRGYIAGQDKAAAQDARQFQNFGQALGMTGQIMQVQDMMRARQDEEQMRQLFRESGGDLKTMRDKAYQSGFYKQGMQFDQTLRKQQEEDLKRTELLGKIDKQKRDQLAAVNDSMGAAYEHAYTVYQTLQRGKVPEQMARAEAQKAWSAARGGLAQDPLMQGAQLPEEFDPDRALLALSQSKRTRELFDRFHKQDTFEETKRSNQAREDAKRVDQGIARQGQGITMRGQDMANARATEANQIAAGQRVNESTGQLRKEFNALPEVKNYKTVVPILRSLSTLQDTSAGDLGLIYGVGKILDPDSVVREGEMTLVIKSGSPLERFRGEVNRIMGGGRLTEKTRQQLTTMLESRTNELKSLYDSAEKTYRLDAQRRNLPADQIFIDIGETPSIQKPSAPTSFNSMPDPKQYAGKRIKDESGTMYKSDGNRWVRQ